MSNFFTDVSKNASQVEEELLGPNYKYYDKIKSPGQLGMSSHGSFSALSKDAYLVVAEIIPTGMAMA